MFAVASGAAEKFPDVVLGPETALAAPAIEAPIADVTVFSDRARVRRRGRAPAKGGGVTVVRFPVLPGGVFVDTVRVSASAGRVLRAESTPIERERLAIAEAAKLLDALDAVDDRIGALDDKRTSDGWEIDLLQRLRPAPPVPEDKREGARTCSSTSRPGRRRWISSPSARTRRGRACSSSTRSAPSWARSGTACSPRSTS